MQTMRVTFYRPAAVLLGAAVALSLAVAPLTAAERGDDTERKSKNGSAEGTVGGVQVKLEYGRPKVQGRAIWGGLVPYGAVWRTGADEATTISFGGDVLVEGKPLAAGTYSLFTIPTAGTWTVIFNRVAEQWGSTDYDQAQDALRVEAQPEPAEATEEMTFAVESDRVVLRWEKLAVPFAVAAAPAAS